VLPNINSVVEFLLMVGPKKQDFCPRINMLKGKKNKNSADE
jgi:hypothetical protein